jgi:hypothetical protein
MAKPTLTLADAMRRTVRRLREGASYQWGHMGMCNCGNLAQEITQMSEAEIHAHALRTREGDWSEQTAEYCAISRLPMDVVITKMMEAGLTAADLKHLEKLSDKAILQYIPAEKRNLVHNRREDVILYFEAWIDLLEDQLIADIELPDLHTLITPTEAVAVY